MILFLQNCYDVPHLTAVHMPIRVTVADIKDDCINQKVPTPKSECWEDEEQLCPSVPELVDKPQTLLRCSFVLSNDDCSKVKLTIPMQICYPVQKYYPYPALPQYPRTQ